MGEEGDIFWVSLAERVIGILVIIIGAIMLYFTATTADLGGFGGLFSVLSIILLILGVFLLIMKTSH